MSVQVMTAVWADSSITDRQDLLVMLALADWSNDEGESWPAMETLARKARCSESSARRSVKRLTTAEKLEVKTNSGPKGTNRYVVKFDWPPRYQKPKKKSKGCQGDTPPVKINGEGCQNGHLGGVTTMTPEPSEETVIEPSIKNTADAAPGSLKLKSDHQEFMAQWCIEFQKHFETGYVVQGAKDGSAVQRLLTSSKLPAGELINVAKAAWNHIDRYPCDAAASIAGFASKFNEIRMKVRNSVQADPSDGWDKAKFYERHVWTEADYADARAQGLERPPLS